MKKKNESCSVRMQTITPADAKRYLESSKRNRPINPMRVEQYARAMRNGTWSPATMLITDEDGDLVDAHHRLHAVVKANVPVEMAVFSGLEKKFVPVIDTGRPRTAGDMLAFIEGLDGVASLRNKSVIARLVIEHRSKSSSYKVGFDEIADFMLGNKELISVAYADYTMVKPLGATLAFGAAMFLIREANPGHVDKIGEFVKQVSTGEMLKSGMPAYALRNAIFLNSKTANGGPRQRFDEYSTLKAWRMFIAGETAKTIRKPKEFNIAQDFVVAKI